MKRFDHLAEMLCTRDCFYGEQSFEAGQSVVMGDHPALRHLADHFEELTEGNAPKSIQLGALRSQLERRERRVEELDQNAATERVRAEREKSRRAFASEDGFWERASELTRERVGIENMPDPAAEQRAEELAEEERIAALPEDDDQFWDQTMNFLERSRFSLSDIQDPDEW